MAETWLQANRRAFLLPIGAAAVIAVACAAGAGVQGHAYEEYGPEAVWQVSYWVLTGAAILFALIAAGLAAIAFTPRISYADGRVKFFVRFGPPVEVPLEHVEAFLIGRGPIFFTDDRKVTTETTTLIVRIAERAEEYHHVQTAPLLAAWCGNQATIRGTWTEPLGLELVNRLNQRLYDVKQERAGATGAT